MGFAFSKFDMCFAKQDIKIIFLGLNNAGKTTIISKLKLGEVVDSIPTQGFNLEVVVYKNVKFMIWDLGTQMKTRVPWKHYLQEAQAIVFVIDSSDPERIQEAKQEMDIALNSDELQDYVLLVLANKQDQAKMSLEMITEILGLRQLQISWFIQGTSVLTGDGIYDSFDWLANKLKINK